jgi:hypothetical protein
MGEVSLTGKDTFKIDNRIFKSIADGDTVVLDIPNDISTTKVGKNGNILIAENVTGKTITATVRVLLASADDKYLNSRYMEFVNDSASFALLEGEFIKRVGDGNGNVNNVVYRMGKGTFTKMPVAKENQEGDTEQSVAVWVLSFPFSFRIIE